MDSLISYIESLHVTQGDLVGQPVTVFPWERRFLKGAFKRGVTTSALSIGRGNGKTSFVAAICAAALDGPLSQPRSEILLVASTLSQARIAYHHVLAFLGNPKADSTALGNHRQPAESGDNQQSSMASFSGVYPAVSLKGRTAQRPPLVIADEPSQWNHNTTGCDACRARNRTRKNP